MTEIKHEHLDNFFECFNEEWPTDYSPEESDLETKYALKEIKIEIVENLTILDKDARVHYLQSLRLKTERILEDCIHESIEAVKKYCKQYEIEIQNVFDHESVNELSIVLKSNIKNPEKTELVKPKGFEFPKDGIHIQEVFVEYFKIENLNELLKFIDMQSNANSQSPMKIDTELSVPQLAYLFRSLVDEKIITPKQKTDLFRAVTSIFKTKGAVQISVESFKNKFDSPESPAIEFWEEKFKSLARRAKEEK